MLEGRLKRHGKTFDFPAIVTVVPNEYLKFHQGITRVGQYSHGATFRVVVRGEPRTKAERERHNEYHRKWRQRNPEYSREKNAQYRAEVLRHYSGGVPSCECCGENEWDFLCLDHINGGGVSERNVYGENQTAWIRSRNFPSGFRVLCHNCNMASRFGRECPHRRIA